MLVMIIALLMVVGILGILLKTNADSVTVILSFLSCLLVFIMFLIIETIPSGDYCEWKTSSDIIQLTQLTDEINTNYVKKSETAITFRYISVSEFGTEKILAKIKKNDNIFFEIVEIDENSQPYMTISEREGKSSFLTFNKQPTQTKYIFYVPAGTVIYENVHEFNY